MADFKSDIVTAKETLKLSSAQHSTGEILLLQTAIVTLTGATATNDTIQVIDLPPGATVVPALSSVTCSADPGTTLTLDVGDAENGDRFADGIVLSAGGQIAFTSGTMPLDAITPARETALNRVVALVASASTITDGTKLIFNLALKIRG